jgi:c-di-GMP-binding flagellar brake protein YcgR
MDERRKEVRIDKLLSISYRISKGLLKSTSSTRNVSQVGLCLPVFQRLDPGIVLEMEMKLLEYRRPITASGEVVWIRENPDNKQYSFEAGIGFIKIESIGKNGITKISEKLSA